MSEHGVWPKSECFRNATVGLIHKKYCCCCARRVNFCEHHIDIASRCHSDIVWSLDREGAGVWRSHVRYCEIDSIDPRISCPGVFSDVPVYRVGRIAWDELSCAGPKYVV